MIPEVKNGQKITAELQNQIIEAVNGQMIPSEGQFVTTKSGPVFSSGVASTTSNPTLVPEQIFHCMYATTYTIDSRSASGTQYSMQGDSRTKAWFVSLVDKDNVMEMLQNNSPLSVADFGVLGKSTSLDGKFDSAWLNRTNWLDTGYDELSAEPSFAWVVEKKEDEDEEQQQKVVYAVLHNENDVENAKQRIAQLFDFEDVDVIKNGKLAVYDNEKQTTRQMLLPTLGSEPQEVLCDSEISSLNQSSIQHLSADEGQMALELFNFHVLSATTEPILSSHDVLVREPGEDNSVTLKYIPLSSVGGAGTSVDVDAQYMASKFPHRYSIDWMPDADNDDKVLQMYRFDESPTNNQYMLRFEDDGQIPQNNISADFIIREYQADAGGVNKEVNYQDGKEVVVPHEVTDGERYVQTGNGHVSINYAQGQQGEPKALQLHNFSSYNTTSDANGLSANGDGILIRKKSSGDNHLELQYLNITGLNKLVSMPSLSALNGLSVVTGIEYPMTGTNQYKIVAHRKQINVVDNVLTVTNLADQTIDTVAHDSIYPNN